MYTTPFVLAFSVWALDSPPNDEVDEDPITLRWDKKEQRMWLCLLPTDSVCLGTVRKWRSTSPWYPRAGRIYSVELSRHYPEYKDPCWWVESWAATSKLRFGIFPESFSLPPPSCQHVRACWRVLGEKKLFPYLRKHFRFFCITITGLFT